MFLSLWQAPKYIPKKSAAGKQIPSPFLGVFFLFGYKVHENQKSLRSRGKGPSSSCCLPSFQATLITKHCARLWNGRDFPPTVCEIAFGNLYTYTLFCCLCQSCKSKKDNSLFDVVLWNTFSVARGFFPAEIVGRWHLSVAEQLENEQS